MSVATISQVLSQSSAANQLNALQNLAQNQTKSTASTTDGTLMFQDIYNSLVSSVNETDSAFQADMVKAAEGELDDPHQLLIDSEKANVSLQLALSVRNKALSAYDDIIKMQL